MRRLGAALAPFVAAIAVGLGATGVVFAAGPASSAGVPAAPRLPASAAALLDADTGQLLWGRAAQRELPIASTTKLMTALIVLEHARLGDLFTEPRYYPAAADSQIGLVPGERMNVHDLLLALLLPSADDAAEDLAYNVGHGSVARFVAMMNARARQLGLTRTHYSTPIGLDTPGNYSTAADLVKLARYVLAKQPFFRHAVALTGAMLRSGSHPRLIANRNDLVGRYSWVTGVKTGHTLGAGYVLVGAGTLHGMTLISAVLGTPSEAARDSSTLAVLRYGFAAFTLRTSVRAGTVLARIPVRYRTGVRAPAVAATTVRRVFARGTVLRVRVRAPAMLKASLSRGSRVGTILVLARGAVVARVALVLAHSVQVGHAPGISVARLAVPITLVLVLLLALAAALATGFGRVRRRGRAAEVRRQT